MKIVETSLFFFFIFDHLLSSFFLKSRARAGGSAVSASSSTCRALTTDHFRYRLWGRIPYSIPRTFRLQDVSTDTSTQDNSRQRSFRSFLKRPHSLSGHLYSFRRLCQLFRFSPLLDNQRGHNYITQQPGRTQRPPQIRICRIHPRVAHKRSQPSIALFSSRTPQSKPGIEGLVSVTPHYHRQCQMRAT